jgi:uncharacterized membrane-anchored protein
MALNTTPRITPRYWTAILLASMCGTNLGDVFPKLLGLAPAVELAILAAAFASLMLVDRLLPRGVEAIYWLSILAVRGAATAIADASIDRLHFGFAPTTLAFAGLMAALLLAYRRAPSGPQLPAGGLFWLTMLTAGTLGTLIGDGLGRAVPSPQIAYPASLAIATLVLALALWRRSKGWASPGAYWLTIVLVRWWGTNAGDIFAHVANLVVSMAVTGVAMALVLALWREPRSGADSALRSAA